MRLVMLAATLRQDRQRAKLYSLLVHEGCRIGQAGNTEELSASFVKSSRFANYFTGTATQT